jgi:GGDEF domain-containing protein
MMQSHLQTTLASLSAEDIPPAVVLLQVQGLAHFRASLGPEAASSLLRVIARTLEGCLRKTDLIGRWSDDQFLLIFNEVQEEEINAKRERIRRMLAGEGIEWWGERRSLPVVIAASSVHLGDTVESVLQRLQEPIEAASGFSPSSAGRRTASASGS